MAEIIRVLLADSHLLLHGGVHITLIDAQDLELVGEATTSEELWHFCQEHQPDVLLLATNMNDIFLNDVFMQAQQRCPEIQILVLLSEPGEISLQQLTENGASGGILKSESPETLLTAIRTVAQGQPWFIPPLLKRILQPKEPPLTDEELAILRLIAAGEKDRAIADTLSLSKRTVRRRIDKICEKLGVETRIEAAYQAGLRWLLEE
jgi:DNA-binding NarL/FixJ family response regulator